MSYTQYIRDTRRAWAKMPKPDLLNEIVDLPGAALLIDSHSGDPASAKLNHADLAAGQVVYLTDGTYLKAATAGSVRRWV